MTDAAEVNDRCRCRRGFALVSSPCAYAQTSKSAHGIDLSLFLLGARTLRRLLIIGSSSVIMHARRRGAPRGSWLEQMLARKPRMLATVANANKKGRIVWALLTKGENYRASVSVAA